MPFSPQSKSFVFLKHLCPLGVWVICCTLCACVRVFVCVCEPNSSSLQGPNRLFVFVYRGLWRFASLFLLICIFHEAWWLCHILSPSVFRWAVKRLSGLWWRLSAERKWVLEWSESAASCLPSFRRSFNFANGASACKSGEICRSVLQVN